MAAASPLAMSVSTPPTSVMADNDNDGVPTLRFTTVERFNHDMALACLGPDPPHDLIIVTDVRPADFDRLDSDTGQRPYIRLRRYDASTKMLFVTIPTLSHEIIHARLYGKITFQIFTMGSEMRWFDAAAARYHTKPNTGAGDGSGEGDSSGGPWPERGEPGSWPTLVIESGYSESQQYLRLDMRWWFAASDHDVKIVLLAWWDRTRQALIIERWEEEIPAYPSRPGATNTRSTATPTPVPVLQQTITITRDPTTVPRTFTIVSGALVLSFRRLFLRDPGPGEGDIVFAAPELEAYAGMVWNLIAR